jgi:hypothetical protein
MVTVWRWLLAATAGSLILAGCTTMAAGPAAGTGAAVSPSAAPGGHRGLSAVRHVWVIELENQGYAQSFGTRLPTRTWRKRCRGWVPCWRTTTR